MKHIKDLAIDLFDIGHEKPCQCGGEHEICLSCKVCRKDEEDKLATDFENLAQYIDHTILKADASVNDVKKICNEAETFNFASVCVNPAFIKLASYQLNTVPACSVIGFPLGANRTETKVFETLRAIEDGADEIDMVMSIGQMITKHYSDVFNDIKAVADMCRSRKKLLKVIIETCYLSTTGKIVGCLLAKKAGAEFVKTSTGFGSGGATVEDIELMRATVGPKLGVKASGGIRDKETAINMLKAGANRIGASQSIYIVST